MISENLEFIKNEISCVCDDHHLNSSEIRLIAVSKTKPNEYIQEAYDYGIRDFGENKVQELVDKYETLPKDIQWHMIGHLQRNKVKYLVGKAFLIHSVDSLRLAKEINLESEKKGCISNILLEVNISNEESKFGIQLEDIFQLVNEISKLPCIRIRGLMTVAPFTENAEDNRVYFKELKKLSVDIQLKNIDNVSMDYLSMGMSGDYKVAMQEGSNMIRIGTSIFGNR